MKLRNLLPALLTLLVFQDLASASGTQIAPSCKATDAKDSRVKGRASSVTFPNGRVITVIGQNHGERQFFDLLERFESGALSKMSDQEFTQLFKRILEQNKTVDPVMAAKTGLESPSVLHHAKNDFAYLEELLIRNKGRQNVSFVGFEGTPAALQSLFSEFGKLHRALMDEYTKRSQHTRLEFSRQEFFEIVSSAVTGNIFFFMKHPEVAERVPLLGTENEKASRQYDKVKPHKVIADVMKKLTDADSAYWGSRPASELEAFKKDKNAVEAWTGLVSIHNRVLLMSLNSVTALQDEWKKLDFSRMPWLTKPLAELFVAYENRINANLERDRESAQTLASQFQSGVHFVGFNHYRNTIENLEQICTRETLNPSAASSARSGGTVN